MTGVRTSTKWSAHIASRFRWLALTTIASKDARFQSPAIERARWRKVAHGCGGGW